VIGIDEIAIRKGHIYRIVVSGLLRGRPIWFGGKDRSESSMELFYAWLGAKKSAPRGVTRGPIFHVALPEGTSSRAWRPVNPQEADGFDWRLRGSYG
jgi:hypothetical protein